MPRRDAEPMSPEAARELEAIDAVLRGEPVDPEWAETAELALLVRQERPQPHEAFAAELDERAASGFRRRRPVVARVRTRLARRKRLGRALAFAAAALAVIVGVGAAVSGLSSEKSTSGGAASSLESSPPPSVTGSSGSSSGSSSAPPPDASAAGTATAATRRVERTSALTLGVVPEHLQDVSSRVFDLTAREFHGYVESSSVSSGDGTVGGGTFALRIPSDQVAAAEARLTRLGHVQAQSDTTQDITSAFVSADHRLADAQGERRALLRALAKATTANQTDAIHARLSAAESQIASAQRDLRALRSRANFTRVSLTLVPETRGVTPGGHGGGFGPGAALHAAKRILSVALGVALVALAVLAPLGVLALLAWLALHTLRRRRREQALGAA